MKPKKNFSYSNKIVIKPWGQEYNIFINKKIFAITYLKIKKGFSTSLHCHPKKKTGFLILSGMAEVQLGIYKKNIVKFKPMSILVLRPGLFHKIKASVLTLYFLLFSTLIFILLIVFINNLLNSRIINEKYN